MKEGPAHASPLRKPDLSLRLYVRVIHSCGHTSRFASAIVIDRFNQSQALQHHHQ